MVAANVLENQKLSRIHRIKLPNNLLAPSKPGAPANYLIIGSDSRTFVDTPAEEKAFGSAAQIGNARSDVMMVVHVVPALGTAFVVSFPRDTYVDIPGHGTNLLNAAFAFGGPALTIKTFQEDFGIPIQHYLAVNFVGFEKIVELDRPREDLLPDSGARLLHRAEPAGGRMPLAQRRARRSRTRGRGTTRSRATA